MTRLGVALQVRPLEQHDRVAKLVKRATVTAQLCSPATEPSHRVTGAAASFLPTPPLQVVLSACKKMQH